MLKMTGGDISMPVVKVNDINIYYEIHGEGEPLVMIGGLGTDVSLFRACISRLSQKFKVLVFDNRGAGLTDKPDSPYSIEMMANDARALMSSVGIESAYVLGVSMGGRIALELTLKYPQAVKRLMLVSTSASLKARISFLPKLIKRLRSALDASAQPYYAFVHQLNASQGYDCSGRFGEIRAPALIMYGKEDRFVPYTQIEEMNAGIKGSKLITFNGGHLFFLWDSKLFVDTILDFLR